LFLKTDGAGNLSFDSLSFSTPLAVIGNATAGSEIRLPEDTDNGSNYVAIKAPDTIASNLTLTLPSADGTSGQVLQTNGSGVLSFSSPSAGSFVFLASTGAGSAVSSADLNGYFTSAYDIYEIFIVNLIGSTDTTLRLRVATGGGYTVQTGSDYNTEQNYNAGGTLSSNPYSSTPAYQLVHIGSSSNFSTTSRITLFKPTSSSQKKNIHGFSIGNYGGNRYFVNTAGYWNSTTAVTGVRILSDGGTITYDNIYLYGIKNS
jgi:hypothetical protein